jgi:hypothetical protein
MTALAVALIVALVPQEEASLKEAWPKLLEAWKAVDEHKPSSEAGLLDDEGLKTAAKLHQAFEAAGLFAAEGEYLPQAVKAFLKQRARALAPAANDGWAGMRGRIRILAAGGPGGAPAAPAVEGDPMGTLLTSLRKLKAMKVEGLDDEDNVQDELVTARKALKALGVTGDDTPPGLRRRAFTLTRALVLGEPYPEPAAATDDQSKQVKAWIAELGHESIENREQAMKELVRAGEKALPAAREALKQGDAEIAARCKQLLGFGHAPWKALAARQKDLGGLEVFVDVPVIVPAPAEPPKEEKPK